MGNNNGGFHLRVSDDRLAIRLDCALPPGNLAPLVERIQTELRDIGIAGGPGGRELEERLLNAARKSRMEIRDLLLLEGKAPIPPVDGRIEWARDFFSGDGSNGQKMDRADFQRRMARLNVDKDTLLLKVGHAREGQPGRDVFDIPIQVAGPRRARVNPGPNVRKEKKEDGDYYFSTGAGRIRWVSQTLAVDEVLTIRGDISPDTGKVRHSGALVIDGDVQAGSRIETTGDIEVGGALAAADILTEGNLTVGGGITGEPDRLVKAAGNVRAEYFQNANVEAGGNLEARTRIINSTIKTRGAVSIPLGYLAGGTVTALGGVTAGQIGNEEMLPTLVVAGESSELVQEIETRTAKLGPLKHDLHRIRCRIDPLMSRKKGLTDEQRQMTTKLLAKAHLIENEVKKLSGEIAVLKEELDYLANPAIVINRIVFTGTTVRLNGRERHFASEVNGPLRIAMEGRLVQIFPASELTGKSGWQQNDLVQAREEKREVKVLVVDDCPVTRKLIIESLKKFGVKEFGQAADGQEAVKEAMADTFSLVLMDWRMPNMQGIEALKSIRALGNDVPIIMVTIEADKRCVIDALRFGANSYIVKPFTPDKLFNKLKKTIAKASA